MRIVVASDKGFSVKQILQACWPAYVETHAVADYQRHEVEKALTCYEGQCGGYVFFCDHCDEWVFMMRGCNSRLCSSCGKRYAEQWAVSLSQALAPVPHRHIVLTAPDTLWPYLRTWDVMRVYMNAAIAAFNDYFSRRLHRHVRVGIVEVLHPFGKDMKWYPHLHLIVSEGGFSADGTFVPMLFIPAAGFRKKWQFEVLRALAPYVPASIINDMYQQHQQGFYVWLHASGRIKHPKQLAKYVGRYVRHPAISNRRITGFDGKTVQFCYTGHEGQQHDVVMSADEFITALIQHVPPKNFKMIRHYGAYARQLKKRYGAKTRSGITQLNLTAFGLERLTKCPFCGHTMTFVWYMKKPPPEAEISQGLLPWL